MFGIYATLTVTGSYSFAGSAAAVSVDASALSVFASVAAVVAAVSALDDAAPELPPQAASIAAMEAVRRTASALLFIMIPPVVLVLSDPPLWIFQSVICGLPDIPHIPVSRYDS